jgi:hypothetical protein
MRIGFNSKIGGCNSATQVLSESNFTALQTNSNSIFVVGFGKVASNILGAFASYGILKTSWLTPINEH